jgi:hypothetical protein
LSETICLENLDSRRFLQESGFLAPLYSQMAAANPHLIHINSRLRALCHDRSAGSCLRGLWPSSTHGHHLPLALVYPHGQALVGRRQHGPSSTSLTLPEETKCSITRLVVDDHQISRVAAAAQSRCTMAISVARSRGRKEARGRDGAFPGLMGDLWPVETNHGRAHARFQGHCSPWVTWRMIC